MAITCIKINTLPEFEMIAGTKQTLEFEVLYEDGGPVDLQSSIAYWVFSPLGQPSYEVGRVPGEIFDTNKFVVSMPGSITEGLHGKFVHQPVFTDYSGQEYRPQQGIFTIIPKIGQ